MATPRSKVVPPPKEPKESKARRVILGESSAVPISTPAVGDTEVPLLNYNGLPMSEDAQSAPPTLPMQPSTSTAALSQVLGGEWAVEDKPSPNKIARGAGSSLYGTRIKCNLPDLSAPDTLKFIGQAVLQHFQENIRANYMIFTVEENVKACWPVCKLSMSRGGDSSTSDLDFSEQKCFGIQFPSFQKATQPAIYYVYKESNKVSAALQLDDKAISLIVKSAPAIYEYLKSIENTILPAGFHEGLPNKPDPILLKMFDDEQSRIVLQVDDPMTTTKRVSRISPTVSIRLMRRGKSSWYPDKSGITLSCQNFFYFVEATLKTFLPQIRAIYSNFHSDFQDSQEELMSQLH